jgi:hypothetical protein
MAASPSCKEANVSALARPLTRLAWTAIDGAPAAVAAVTFTGDGGLPSTFAVTDFASAAVATAGLAVAELAGHLGGNSPAVSIDRRLTSFWLGSSIRPIGWELPPLWDALAGDYRAGDGWIRLHTNAPHHRAAARRVLGQHADRNEVARAVTRVGGSRIWKPPSSKPAAARPRCARQRNGRIIRKAAPLRPSRWCTLLRVGALHRVRGGRRHQARWRASGFSISRACWRGPSPAAFLAGYGAQVLRIDPPDWNEPSIVPEMTLGKRCARLDLRAAQGGATFEALLRRG